MTKVLNNRMMINLSDLDKSQSLENDSEIENVSN